MPLFPFSTSVFFKALFALNRQIFMLNIYCIFLPLECYQNWDFLKLFFSLVYPKYQNSACYLVDMHSLNICPIDELVNSLTNGQKVIPLSLDVTWFQEVLLLGLRQILLFFRAWGFLSKLAKAQRAKQPCLPSAVTILHKIITANVFIHFTFNVPTSIMSS